MKKFLLSIFCCLMAVFAVQAQDATATLSFASTAQRVSQDSNSQVWSNEGITFTNNKASSSTPVADYSNPVRLYAKSEVVVEIAAGTITKMEFTCGGSSYATALKNSVGDEAAVSGSVVTVTPASASNSYTIASLTAQVRIKEITVTYATSTGGDEGGDTPTPVVVPAPIFNPADGATFDENLSVAINAEEGLTIYYSTDGKVSYTEGNAVTIAETTTVYAYAEDANGNKSEVAEATFTKNEPETPVTPPAEGEVVDVINLETIGVTSYSSYTSWGNVSSNSSAVYAGQSHKNGEAVQLRATSPSGIVTTVSGGKAKKVVVAWASNTTSGRTLNVYGKSTAYTTSSDLYDDDSKGTLLGTIICGTSTELVIEGDYEYIGLRSASGAMYLTSVSITWDASAGVTPVAPNAPILPASTTFEGSISVEITGIAADATVYYTTDESDPATSLTRIEYTEPLEITATTTVKAVAVNEVGASEPATATYTLFVLEETEGYYMKVVAEPADWSGKYLIVYEEGTEAYVFNGVDEANGYVSAITDGDVINANSEIDAVAVTIAAMEGGYSISTAGGYIASKSSGNGLVFGTEAALNTLECATDGVVITSNEKVLRFNDASNQKRFRYYGDGQKAVELYKYVETLPMSYTLTVTDAGWATLYLGFNARIPSAVEAYTVTAVNDGWVSLTQVTGVLPSQQGVIIKASAGDYKFFYEATATADVEDNLLAGTLYNKYVDEEAYVLANGEDGVGLYKAQLTDGTFLNNANKAYLPASAVLNKTASFYGFNWNGTTGVEAVEAEGAMNGKIYDITGREVETITVPGIYIVNGSKVVIK